MNPVKNEIFNAIMRHTVAKINLFMYQVTTKLHITS